MWTQYSLNCQCGFHSRYRVRLWWHNLRGCEVFPK